MPKLTRNRIKFLFKQFLKGNFRNAFRYKLWLIGYQQTLPSFIIRSIPIIENGEALVQIPKHSKIVCVAPIALVRESVAGMLVQVAESLPQNLALKILYAYRDQEMQKEFWNEAIRDTNNEETAQKLSAKPDGIGPHQTGGAVDVTLIEISSDGTSSELYSELPMGTNYREYSNIAKIPMFSKFCTQTEKQNRTVLRKAMLGAGFYFYPGEWWHYSYGDQMWSAYTGESCAIYGEKFI